MRCRSLVLLSALLMLLTGCAQEAPAEPIFAIVEGVEIPVSRVDHTLALDEAAYEFSLRWIEDADFLTEEEKQEQIALMEPPTREAAEQELIRMEVLNARVAAMRSVELLNFARTAGDSGVNVLAMQVEDVTPDMLRTLSDSLRDKAPNLVSVLALVHDGKINFVAACGKEAVKKGAHAGNILKQIAKIAGGGGGGRPDSATAGGKDVSKLEEALEAVNNIVEQMVK